MQSCYNKVIVLNELTPSSDPKTVKNSLFALLCFGLALGSPQVASSESKALTEILEKYRDTDESRFRAIEAAKKRLGEAHAKHDSLAEDTNRKFILEQLKL